MEKSIEIEIRGLLSTADRSSVLSFLKKNGKFKERKERIFIDYSTFVKGEGIRNRTRDIRLRCTNGVPEIMVKTGTWGEGESRKEHSVKAKKGEFDMLVQIFGVMGFGKGVLCVRKSEVFEYKGIEISIVEVPNHSYYFEFEKMVNEKENYNQTIKEIKKTIKELGLKEFNGVELFEYMEKLNEEANEIFEYSQYKEGYFQKRFGI